MAVLFLIAGAVPVFAGCTTGCCGAASRSAPSHDRSSHFEGRECCAETGVMPCCHPMDGREDVPQPMAVHAARLVDAPVAAVLIMAVVESDPESGSESAFAAFHREGSRADPVPVFLLNLSLLI